MPEAKIAPSSLLRTGIAACVVAIDKHASAIQIFPAGTFDTPLGTLIGKGPWQLNAETAGQLISTVAARQNDILIDYEHQSLSANTLGHAAPAAGWIKPQSLVWQDDGLYAQNPDWNARAAAMIDAGEYRYLSPVFTYDTKTGAPQNLISIALTNTPAIDGMTAVSLAAAMAGYLTPQDTAMDELLERLRYLLNLPLTSTADEISAELDKLKVMIGATATADTAAASLTVWMTGKELECAALKAASPDPAKYVPIEAFLAVQQQRNSDAEDSKGQQVAALIAAHPGVIVPALKTWATELGKQDLNTLQEFIKNAQPIAALTRTQTQGKAPKLDTGDLDETELAVCRATGIDPDYFKQTRSN